MISNHNREVSSHGVPIAALPTQVSSFASEPATSAQRVDGCLHQCALRHGYTRVKQCTVAQRRIMMGAGACTTMEQVTHFTCTGMTTGLTARDAARSRSCDCPEMAIYLLNGGGMLAFPSVALSDTCLVLLGSALHPQ